MKTLSLGKFRALQQCSTPNGGLSIMALDHRNNLRRVLNPESPDSVTYEQMAAFKQQVVAATAPAASAVLLDPEFSAGECVASGALPGDVGLVVAVEATGYTGDISARHSEILPGWSVAKSKRMGANAIKLLVYYHPDSPTAGEIEDLVRVVGADCEREEIPLFLEPLSYSLDPNAKKLPPDERRRVVIETARRLTPLGVDILKAEFPLDTTAEANEVVWQEACEELSAASIVPWVLLSASVDYDTYVRQVTAACRAGASGVAAGRAVWKEASSLAGDERTAFLRGEAHRRMARLTALCDGLARPWMAPYHAPTLGNAWYVNY